MVHVSGYYWEIGALNGGNSKELNAILERKIQIKKERWLLISGVAKIMY